MTDREIRFAEIEFREVEGAAGRVTGIAIKYGDTAKLPGFRERFEPGAFGDVTSLDVIANVQHERTRPLARTDGGGLELADGADALRATLELPATRDGEDTAELLKRRVLRGMSIEFGDVKERFERGVRIVERATLYGIGLVDKPAYPQSLAAIAKRAADSIAETQEPRRRIVVV